MDIYARAAKVDLPERKTQPWDSLRLTFLHEVADYRGPHQTFRTKREIPRDWGVGRTRQLLMSDHHAKIRRSALLGRAHTQAIPSYPWEVHSVPGFVEQVGREPSKGESVIVRYTTNDDVTVNDFWKTVTVVSVVRFEPVIVEPEADGDHSG